MKKSSKKLFMMEIVLSILILVISLSVTNLIFVRSMTQHQRNEAIMKMSETMVMLSEELQNEDNRLNIKSEYIVHFDSNGNEVETTNTYRLVILLDEEEFTYPVYRLSILSKEDVKLLSWDVVKVVE